SSGFQNGVATGEPLPGGRGSPDALPHTVTTTGAVDSLCRNLAWIIVSVVRSADRPVSRRGSVEPLSGRRGRPDGMGLVEGVTLLHPPPHPDRADRLGRAACFAVRPLVGSAQRLCDWAGAAVRRAGSRRGRRSGPLPGVADCPGVRRNLVRVRA